MRRFLNDTSRPVSVLWLLTAAFCILLVGNLLPWLRGDVPWLPGDLAWRWPYELPRWLWVIPCAIGIAIYVMGAAQLLHQSDQADAGRYPARLILWAFVGAALLPILLMTMEGRPLFLLFTRSASTLTGGYQYGAAQITDLGYTLRHWTEFAQTYQSQTGHFPSGIALSPPGLAVAYVGFRGLFEGVQPLAETFGSLVRPLECQNLVMMTWTDATMASAWPQMFMPLWGALAVAPLYRLGTMIFNRKVASWAIALWPLVPGMSLFSPMFNTFYPLIALVMLVALWRGLQWNQLKWIVIAGFVLSVGTFLNLAVVPLGLLAGLTIIGYVVIQPDTTRVEIPTTKQWFRLLWILVAFGIGSASVWVIYSGLSGMSPLDVLQLGMGLHLRLDRPYVPWLFMHPYDMYLFVGLPIAILSIWQIIRVARTRRLLTRADIFAGAAGLTLIILVLSGTARGETGRVWLFFAPLWILLAAGLLQNFNRRERTGIMIMQALCLFSMAAVLRADFTALTVPPTPPSEDHGPTFAMNTQFVRGEDKVTLVGLDIDKSPQGVTLYLHWRADTPIKGTYQLSFVPVPPDKSVRPSINWNPLDWNYPPSCWMPGQVFVDAKSVPSSAVAGDWLFSLSILDTGSKEPMAVVGQGTTQVGIGPVNVPGQ